MSQENADNVRRFLDAWNRRDFDDAARIIHPDLELHLVGGFEGIVGEEFDGPDGVLRFSREIVATIGGRIAVDRTIDLGERVALIATLEGAGVESGVPTKMQFGQVWTFRDAKVIRVDSYYDPEQALEAAGLSE